MTKAAIILSILGCLVQGQWDHLDQKECLTCGNHFKPGDDLRHLEEIKQHEESDNGDDEQSDNDEHDEKVKKEAKAK